MRRGSRTEPRQILGRCDQRQPLLLSLDTQRRQFVFAVGVVISKAPCRHNIDSTCSERSEELSGIADSREGKHPSADERCDISLIRNEVRVSHRRTAQCDSRGKPVSCGTLPDDDERASPF